MELTSTNTKVDGVKTELMNTKTDLATKLDGERLERFYSIIVDLKF